MNAKRLGLALTIAALLPLNASASLVGVTDSGTDFEHVELAPRAWNHLGETANNRVDDDRNGKVDDILGWNFVENYNRIFFREHLNDIHPIVYRLMEIIAHKQAHKETPEEIQYWNENILTLTKEQKEALINHLNFFGQYAHSTHVSGIIVGQAPQATLMSSRMFPDDLAPPYPLAANLTAPIKTMGISDILYKVIAAATNGTFAQIAQYYAEQSVDVANYSVGVSMKMLATQALAIRGNKNPTAAELSAEAKKVYKPFAEQGEKWLSVASKTLFVIAAGNDGSDNDALPTFPANIRADNAITVAASQDWDSLAEFSCYGQTTVDLAAPGVAIISTVPSLDRQAHLPMSGTSMAAPFVTGVAAHIKDINPSLMPVQIREILMKTVDHKEWLKNKVVSAGVVNPERAYEAAAQSRSLELSVAISNARQAVADRATTHSLTHAQPKLQDPVLNQWAKELVF